MVKESVSDREVREVTIKKRRKTTTAPASSTLAIAKIPEGDVYKNVMEFEEDEACLRDPENDVLLFKNTCDEIRKAMHEVAELKKKNTEQAQAEIAEKRTATSLLFVFLKKLNRLEKFRTKKSRDILNKEKQQVDSYHLQLQNLLYEKLHLKKEVTKCLEFKSKDEEIDLVPVEEFFKEAPEHISRPISKSDPHQLKLARLEWELLQRKQLADQCQQLQEAKEKVAAEIQSKRERMENITPRLNNILEVTQPLQDYLGLPLDKVRKQHQVAYLLPRPLYILYVQADAYREACDKLMTVIVGGDEEEAVRLQHSMATGSNDLENNDDSDSDPELEAPEDIGDRQKRHNRKMSRQDRLEERKKRLLLSHPLYVEIQIKLPDNNHIVITFHYLINLRVVTVKPVVGFLQGFHGISANDLIASQNILSELFHGDDGSESPNVANHYQLSNVGLDHFKAYIPLLGIPYIWAQRLAGLDFMASRPDVGGESRGAVGNEEVACPEVSQASMESVVKAIRHRLKARLALCRQVQAFEAGGIPVLPALRNMFATKFGAELASWHIATWDDYKVASTTQRLVQAGAVTRADNLYRAVINRGTARLIALVAVKPDYPRSPAVFSLNLHWNGEHNSSNDDAIRDMEAEVNVHWRELAKGRGWGWGLLAAQFLRLISCLDIHLEASAPNEFPRDKVFFKPVRGRNRARPYKYLPIGGGIFSQR
ncbi:THO complex subunit 5 homolog A isoform X2 [Hetaerina americana]|uniref:THO complex subunit 5 homolog A isoform X2 n=1 Tax=Hetaerina americana TaxID=62018 RepID=UPI003A7F5A3A